MTEKQHKEDFQKKYQNIVAIKNDSSLKPAEQVCELIKHYSMCLFGLAADISDFYEQLNKRDKQIEKLKSNYASLYQKLQRLKAQPKRLRMPLTSEERQAIKADYYEKQLQYLRTTVSNLRRQNRELEERLNNGK